MLDHVNDFCALLEGKFYGLLDKAVNPAGVSPFLHREVTGGAEIQFDVICGSDLAEFRHHGLAFRVGKRHELEVVDPGPVAVAGVNGDLGGVVGEENRLLKEEFGPVEAKVADQGSGEQLEAPSSGAPSESDRNVNEQFSFKQN